MFITTSAPPDPAADRTLTLTNLSHLSKSPYVRSHASNPTAWQPWSPATLALARRTNRLLFVSIGYSACHWCHVMASESFAHPRIAALLNEHFIPVKVDREERPDVDRQYMDFLQATTGSGGWPLNVFVTPEGEPIFGGTYWAGPLEGGGTGQFEEILGKVAGAWREQEARCRESAEEIVRQLRDFAAEGTLRDGGEGEDGLEMDVVEEAVGYWRGRFDGVHGGFGGAPKFPTPVHLAGLLRVGAYPREVREIVGEEECDEARAMAVKTLEGMALGGIKDQIGHGFARYSVTRDWSLPHFEKMLYDNAQLLPVYLDAYLLTKAPLFLEMVHDIAQYLTSPPMLSPLGGFHASEDADSLPTASDKHKREGAYYVWTMDDLTQLLTPVEAALAASYYNVQPAGNIDARHDAQGELTHQNTLCVRTPLALLAQKLKTPEASLAETLTSAKAKLRLYRTTHRPPPACDDKLVTAWNGLAIGALARAASALNHAGYLASATRAAACIRDNLYDPTTQTLRRVYREGPGETPGFADDYAFLIAGLLDLYAAGYDSTWLAWAEALQRTQMKLFWDEGRGGFFSTPAGQEDILVRTKDVLDNAEPSVNGVSAGNLFRLGGLLEEGAWIEAGKRLVGCFEVEIAQSPGVCSGILGSVVVAKMGVRVVVVAGEGEVAKAMLEGVREGVRGDVAVVRVGGGVQDGWVRERNALLKEVDPAKEMVQVCEGGVCRVLDLAGVEAWLAE